MVTEAAGADMGSSVTGPTMPAARWFDAHDVRLTELPVPTPAADEALVEVLWVGLCGSDLEEYLYGPIVISGPVTLGHEIVGRVARAAPDGSGPNAGTTVVVDVVTGCGRCFWCQSHEEGLCPDLKVTGFDVDGGLARFVRARAARLVPVPDGLDPKHAALAEPLAVAVRAARKLGPLSGRGAVVIGGGTIGLLVAQVLRHEGVDTVVIEPHRYRRDVAEALGLAAIWADSSDARAEAISSLFPSRGVDIVVECSGADGAAAEAILTARAGGTILLLSVTPNNQTVSTTHVVLKEQTIIGSAAHMWDDDIVPAVALLASGAIDVAPLLTHTFPLSEASAAFATLADSTQNAFKILIHNEGLSRS